MKYTVTITKSETTKKVVKEYERLYDSEAFEKIYAKNPKADQYGYVGTEKDVTDETQVFRQVTEDLNLKAVIDAINK